MYWKPDVGNAFYVKQQIAISKPRLPRFSKWEKCQGANRAERCERIARKTESSQQVSKLAIGNCYPNIAYQRSPALPRLRCKDRISKIASQTLPCRDASNIEILWCKDSLGLKPRANDIAIQISTISTTTHDLELHKPTAHVLAPVRNMKWSH